MIHSLPTWAMLALCLLMISSCETQPVSPEKAVGVEIVLDDTDIPKVGDARIIVLPTGERILVLTGPEGLATCCLLPPKTQPAAPSTPVNVEKP